MNEKNIRLVTAESVRAGHPDKFCDQVADAILDAHLRQDLNARVAVEVFATAGKIIVGGEVTSKAKVSYDKIVAGVINRIGYTMSDLCGAPHGLLELEVCLHEQSPDISAAVGKTELGAGDQGIVVGYATSETEEYLPLPVVLAHRICRRLDELKPSTPWLGADGKAQVTVAYENDMPVAVTAVVVSLQHDAEIDHKSIRRFIGKEVLGKVLPRELLKRNLAVQNISQLISDKGVQLTVVYKQTSLTHFILLRLEFMHLLYSRDCIVSKDAIFRPCIEHAL